MKTAAEFEPAFVPRRRDRVEFRLYGNESVVWAPGVRHPVWLDEIASIVYQIIDGDGAVGELISDTVQALGVSQDVATAQIRRSLATLQQAGALESSDSREDDLGGRLDFYPFPPST